MTHAIRVHETGGPEKLIWEEIEVSKPGLGQVLVRNTAIGLNFIDAYYRSGLYSMNLPFTLGSEGAGIIEALGPKVKGFKVGDRVAYADPIGAYAEKLLRPADRLVKIPPGVSEATAAAILLKGMTAQYLLRRTYRVRRGETILVHAAAGGVGQILCQWAKHLGAVVIGTVSTEDKALIAKKAGARYQIVTGKENFVDRVREITKGKGVPVVYDGIGNTTFMQSLDCLSPRGLMVSYGNASGAVNNFPLSVLAQKGSLYLTRPTLGTYVSTPNELKKTAQELFSLVKRRVIHTSMTTYPLEQAAEAHRDLEARKTTGSVVLIPNQ